MSTRIGIVGMPNAGKSSLFNALTKAGAEAANYPFTTIEPNVAVVPVKVTAMLVHALTGTATVADARRVVDMIRERHQAVMRKYASARA